MILSDEQRKHLVMMRMAKAEDALADASPFDRVTAPVTIQARYDAAYLDRWLPAVITRLRQSGLA